MARPKGSGGRSLYDRYRKFVKPSKKRSVTIARNTKGQFMTKASTKSKFDKSYQKPRYRGRKSRFDK
jgi:hypothetical protein